jgi:hypothetical protein
MRQQFQTDIYFLIQRPISTFLIKYYGHKAYTQIVLIKDVNASDMIIHTLSLSGLPPAVLHPSIICYTAHQTLSLMTLPPPD